MAQKLSKADENLIDYQAYKGVRLTGLGTRVALEVIRHHRLIELYLSQHLGMPWDQVHDEAEKLEHVISEDLEERMAAVLKNPGIDPHGSPIPTKDGRIATRPSIPLDDVEEGLTVEVVEVADRDPNLLRYLGELDLYPGNRFTVLGRKRFGKSIRIERAGREVDLGEEAIPFISVKIVNPAQKEKSAQ